MLPINNVSTDKKDNNVEVAAETTTKENDDKDKKEDSAKNEKEEVNKTEEKIETDSKADSKEESEQEETVQTQPSTEVTLSTANIPAYSGSPYVAINDNVPQFLETDLSTSSYEYYSDLDSLGRCGVVYACIGKDLMPTEERGEIGSVKPTGWHTVKYDVVDGKYLYNRCHLIGYQLSGENANTKNLITGTRYLNMDGMLPFENMVADYVQETGNHVMYRVTPIFEGDNLLASGVQMEAKSVEDNGAGILFNVYCYNVQPEVTINYATGESSYEGGTAENTESAANDNENAQSVDESSNTSSSGSSTMVWVSETGSKYHSINNCGRMNPDKARQMTEEEAKTKGLEKCSKCW